MCGSILNERISCLVITASVLKNLVFGSKPFICFLFRKVKLAPENGLNGLIYLRNKYSVCISWCKRIKLCKPASKVKLQLLIGKYSLTVYKFLFFFNLLHLCILFCLLLFCNLYIFENTRRNRVLIYVIPRHSFGIILLRL